MKWSLVGLGLLTVWAESSGAQQQVFVLLNLEITRRLPALARASAASLPFASRVADVARAARTSSDDP